ncbi:MAG: bifunctional ornithine acetyltransferase/N-acetylglutamate synthase, partial [Frankia sp.]|nr:bifunctional ornithine acetyltransferase/N-acetylglutamate synthase [Frankia sp.]
MTAGVTAARGFRAAGISAGLRRSARPDLALVVNDTGAAVAAVFTSNTVQAAPVQWTRPVVSAGRVRAVVLNSGSANACTGEAGRSDARKTAECAADLLGIDAAEVALA